MIPPILKHKIPGIDFNPEDFRAWSTKNHTVHDGIDILHSNLSMRDIDKIDGIIGFSSGIKKREKCVY